MKETPIIFIGTTGPAQAVIGRHEDIALRFAFLGLGRDEMTAVRLDSLRCFRSALSVGVMRGARRLDIPQAPQVTRRLHLGLG